MEMTNECGGKTWMRTVTLQTPRVMGMVCAPMHTAEIYIAFTTGRQTGRTEFSRSSQRKDNHF